MILGKFTHFTQICDQREISYLKKTLGYVISLFIILMKLTVMYYSYAPEIIDKDNKDEEYDFYKPHYKVLKKIDLKICNRLASQLSNKCKEAYLIKIGYNSGGTIGWLGGYYIFGIIAEDNNEYIVPLKFFNLKNLALNFLEKKINNTKLQFNYHSYR